MPKWYGGSALNPDEIIPLESQWMIQFFRAKRWHDRVLQLKQKSESEKLSAYDFDTLIAFFQNCYHFRDWLLFCKPDLREEVDMLFRTKFEMGACRDICNGYKHKALMRPSHDADFNFYREYDYDLAAANKNPEIYNMAFAYENDIKKYNVFDLAEKCFDSWVEFLEDKRLFVSQDKAN